MRVRVERLARRVDTLVPCLPVALISSCALLAARFIPLERMPLIPCGFKRLTGWPCLFCGMTRSFSAFAHGRPGEAFAESPVGATLYLVTFVMGSACIVTLFTRWRVRVSRPDWLTGTRLAWTLGAVLVANWLYRVLTGRV